MPSRSHERIATHRRRREEPESLRSEKQKLAPVDVEPISSPSMPGVVMASGRGKCHSQFQVDHTAGASASAIEPAPDTSEQRPSRKRKRASSTPPAPRASQLSQLRPRRHCRSRAGSPAIDLEHPPALRFSARLAKRAHALINSRSSDIYTHLAGPEGAKKLLSDPPTNTVTSTSNGVPGAQSDNKCRGRRRKTLDLGDENVKKDMMEEWARLRQSQGILPLSGINENACFGQFIPHDTEKGDGIITVSTQLEMTTQISSPDPELLQVKKQTGIVVIPIIPQSQETLFDVPSKAAASTPTENTLAARTNGSGKISDHEGMELSEPLDGGAEQPIVPDVETEAPSTSIPDPRPDQDSLSDLCDVPETVEHTGLLQRPEPSASRRGSVRVRYTRAPTTKEAEGVIVGDLSRDSPSVISHTQSFDRSMCLDSHEEFYMLDIPDILTLPWESVASQLYVPPGLGKLVSGMREQLKMEARARQRAEELYQGELRQRMSAEKIIQGLRTRLEELQAHLADRGSAS